VIHTPLTVEKANGVALVAIHERREFDQATLQQMHDQLRALADKGTHGVVLDLANISALPPPMVTAMITLRRAAEQAGLELVVGRMHPDFDRIFRVRQLDKLFRCFDSCEAASGHLNSQPPATPKPA
jgi:anti-anti-sigma regulatory factor